MDTYVIVWTTEEDWNAPTIMHTDADSWDEAYDWAVKELNFEPGEMEDMIDKGTGVLIVENIRQ